MFCRTSASKGKNAKVSVSPSKKDFCYSDNMQVYSKPVFYIIQIKIDQTINTGACPWVSPAWERGPLYIALRSLNITAMPLNIVFIRQEHLALFWLIDQVLGPWWIQSTQCPVRILVLYIFWHWSSSVTYWLVSFSL